MSEGKELPAHIAAALRSAGGKTDTGGQQWAGRDLGEGEYHQFPEDDGATPVALAAALRELVTSRSDPTGAGEIRVIQALAQARVFVPILAAVSASEITDDGLVADKESEMALVTIAAPDGRRALPVFSNVAALSQWHSEARPVAVYAPRAALSAVAENAELMVLDPSAEFTFVARRPALWALAQQRPWQPSYADESLRSQLESEVSQWFAQHAPGALRAVGFERGTGVDSSTEAGQLVPGGGAGPELRLALALKPGLGSNDVGALVNALNSHLAGLPAMAERVDSLQIRLESAR